MPEPVAQSGFVWHSPCCLQMEWVPVKSLELGQDFEKGLWSLSIFMILRIDCDQYDWKQEKINWPYLCWSISLQLFIWNIYLSFYLLQQNCMKYCFIVSLKIVSPTVLLFFQKECLPIPVPLHFHIDSRIVLPFMIVPLEFCLRCVECMHIFGSRRHNLYLQIHNELSLFSFLTSFAMFFSLFIWSVYILTSYCLIFSDAINCTLKTDFHCHY